MPKRRPAPSSDDEPPEEVPRRRARLEAQPPAEPPPRRQHRPPPPPADEDSDGAEDEEEEEEEEQEEDPMAALRDVPFRELQRLQGDGRGLGGRSLGGAAVAAAAAAARARRANKNRPAEMSSRRPVPLLAPQLGAEAAGMAPARKAGRDPRFESLSGELSDAAFRKRYAFVFEEKLPEERRRLKTLLQREKKPARREELKAQLARISQQLKRDADARTADKRERERRTREKEAVKGGKKPFYLKKSEAKKEDLLAKYAELKASGQLESFMAKRRAKLAAKDHVHMPHLRRGE